MLNEVYVSKIGSYNVLVMFHPTLAGMYIHIRPY